MQGHDEHVKPVPHKPASRHYHIRWSSSALDWEAFSTREKAVESARRLARPSETYTIEALDGDCPQCVKLGSN